MRAICDEHLEGRYDLEVIDVYQQPVLAKSEQIIAAPTLIRKLPLPLRRIIGDMSNRDRVLGVLEHFGYRQLATWWRIVGVVDYFRGKQGWGTMKRKGFATT